MDGPIFNWKLYDTIVEERYQNDDYLALIDIGSCSLHVVHGAFKSGVQKTEWGIHGLFKAVHNLFDESPAKKEKITKILLDLRFFHYLSVDTDGLKTNKLQTDLLMFGPSLLNKWTKPWRNQRVKFQDLVSFATLGTAIQDGLIVAKLQFISSTATIIMPHFQKLQGNAPLVHFMTWSNSTIGDFGAEIHKRKWIAGSKQSSQHCLIKCIGNRHSLATADIDVLFAATATFTKALKEKKLSQLQIYEFKKECCAMVATIVTKIQERHPLKYNFARKLASLDPRLIVANTVANIFKQVFTKFDDMKWRTTEQADGILTQYKKFVSDMKQFHHEKFAGFKFGEDRLDAFFYDVLNTQKTCEDCWTTIVFLLTLSHSQAAVERGFSRNKEALAPKSQRR